MSLTIFHLNKKNASKLMIFIFWQTILISLSRNKMHIPVGSSRGTKCMRHSVGSLSFIFFLLFKKTIERFLFDFFQSGRGTYHWSAHWWIMSSLYRCVKFDFLESSSERMIMKCTNVIQQDNKDSDDDNQDSKKKIVFLFVS